MKITLTNLDIQTLVYALAEVGTDEFPTYDMGDARNKLYQILYLALEGTRHETL